MIFRLRLFGCAMLLAALGLLVASGVFQAKADDGLTPSQAVDLRSLQATSSEEMTLRNLSLYHLVQLRGGWEWLDTPSHDRLPHTRFNDAVIEGTFVGTWLEMNANFNGQTFELTLDNALPTRLIVPKTAANSYFRLINNLIQGSHHFLLRLVDRAGSDLQISRLRTDGNWLRGDFSRHPRLLGFGSSTIDFCGITWQLGQRTGWEEINRGIGGSTVVEDGQYRVARDVLSQHPEVVFINYGSNDWFSNLSLAQFKPAYLSMLNQIGRGLPQADVVVMGLFPRKGGNEVTRPLYNKAIKEALSLSVLADRARYVEVTNYNYGTGSSDGTHPNSSAVTNVFVPQLLPYFTQFHPTLPAANPDDGM